MYKVRFILKNGVQFEIVCDSITSERNTVTGELVRYDIKGITGLKPHFIKMSEVAAILTENLDQCEEEDEEE